MTTIARLAFAAVAGSLVAAAPGPARAAAPAVEHVIRSGDNLHLLAGYYYRDPRQWRRIWQANRALVAAPSRIPTGNALRIEGTEGLRWEIPYEEFRARVRGR